MQRTSGVLMHISSLANRYGIGSFGQEAYQFVDFLRNSKQTYWQILPLTTTSYGDSPYQSFSAFAGNTHLIDLEALVQAGWLQAADLEAIPFQERADQVDYHRIFQVRRPLLEKAVQSFQAQASSKDQEALADFIQEQASWLDPFCRYMAVKEAFDLKSWTQWPQAYQDAHSQAVQELVEDQEAVVYYHQVTQFWFFQQWQALKAYANRSGIQIIGDMPIYVAYDSVEMWLDRDLFKTDAKGRAAALAGTPPDNFTADGQFWGNPIYDWDYMKQTGYAWWIDRIQASLELYDVLRIDHFRGFESYWEVPADAQTAAEGRWVKGPGLDLFQALQKALGDLPIIAEDLGFMTDEVIAMRDATGYPGMKILQFGFEGDSDSTDLPHHYPVNSIAYVGTHDNETARGWWEDTANQDQRDQVDRYLNRRPGQAPSQVLNQGLAASVSQVVIYTMQDLLDLGNEARMNQPSTIGCNWQWRMSRPQVPQAIQEELTQITETYFRVNPQLVEES
ncbi:4-alpha-glucanotransferase [Hutsoniella sourekii]